jgi:GTP cyclohydrolase II
MASLEVKDADVVEQSCVTLAKLARLLPAALIVEAGQTATADIPAVQASSIQSYMTIAAHSLTQVSEARVPLENAENARVLAFRPRDGGIEHLAIIVGDLNPAESVLVRLHSECFTGDLVGSLRCDCGNQLRGAIGEMAAAGSGILLYMAQEGRGIGLVNKLRAYQLQDAGFDTVDANLQLGFDSDERNYLPAAQILRLLGVSRVKLMTNNPAKVTALGNCGIEVVERVPHIYPSNQHNDAYLKVKAKKSGHLF